MDRHAHRGQLSGVRFRLATVDDDAVLRQLLRRTPMGGQIALTLERSPSYFRAAALLGDDHRAIVATDEAGQLLCAGEVIYRDRYVNGQPRCVGCLGGLRLARRARSSYHILRQGYRFYRSLVTPQTPHFTSIAVDNTRARRFLEAGLPGMPAYRPIDTLTTFTLRTRSVHSSLRQACVDDWPAILELLDRHNASRQLAPVWHIADLNHLKPCHGIDIADFIVAYGRDRLMGTAALWDQRSFKQVVVRGYSRPLAFARPMLNLLSPLLSTPRLPPTGQPLANAYLSHLAIVDDAAPDVVPQLVQGLLDRAHRRGLDCLSIAFADRDPLAAKLSPFRGHRYRTQLYLVEWPDDSNNSPASLDNRPAAPEVALL